MFRLAFIALFSLFNLFPMSQDQPKRIVFFGDSITAGYGIPIESAFPALIQKKIEEADLDYQVINAGLSGETTAGGLNRIDWILRSKPDVFVLELGGNDGLRGLSMEESEKNLKAMIEKVRKANPKAEIILAGMQIPPNLGQEYTSKFKSLFPDVAKEMNTKLIPFLLEGVGGDPKLNLSDGIHPNQKGHEIVAETVWEYLKPML
ncbi:arylesterase [Roseivirga spongicola]|uniref:Arylesterase n=2 Tax=Roseivirgaceae TaxID=2762306 RepID=A0A150XHV3_9BACT|nr:arylesterase [Roseivirga spongicola]MBO6660871.1 arylesterase [Roseivirga sp.]MBO6759467.1 arylesterase [Roseivirga sp.]MBO6909145.1 arylesterase [Roseivirga sp.]